MGIEFQHKDNKKTGKGTTGIGAPPPLVLGLQPAALVDHVAKVDWSLISYIPSERGGSFPLRTTGFVEIKHEVSSRENKIIRGVGICSSWHLHWPRNMKPRKENKKYAAVGICIGQEI